MQKLVLATRNKGKVLEIRELLADLPYEVVGLEEYPSAPEVAETGASFTENAMLKASAIAKYTGELAMADDSGLEVDYLSGAPGVYSARFGETGWNDQQRYEFLLSKLTGVPESKRTARFRSVVVVYNPRTGVSVTADGSVEGRILEQPKGTNGFGYDPIFYLPDEGLSMAELTTEAKNQMSHRARAIRKIVPKLKEFQG